MASKILILDVEEDKYDGLVEALQKRPHIRVLSLERDGRKQLTDCPCCSKRLSRETTFTINELLVNSLMLIVEKMVIAKSVVLTNKENPAMLLSQVEGSRSVEVDGKTIARAETLGLLKSYQDGSQLTHFVTAAGLSFLSGGAPASPCSIVTLDGDVLETYGELSIDDVKFKDSTGADQIKMYGSKAVKALPERVMEFVTNGQTSLI